MQITGISLTKRGRWAIEVEGGYYGVIHPDLFARCSLSVGNDVPKDILDEMIRETEGLIARERAIRLLSARSYTSQGLYLKLTERYGEAAAYATVERMTELGLLNDRDYARRYALDAINLKGHSYRMIARTLKEKGIDRDVIEETLATFEEDDETMAARLVLRKYTRYLDSESGCKKTIDALVRRGFRYGDARRVVDNLAEDADYYNDLLTK